MRPGKSGTSDVSATAWVYNDWGLYGFEQMLEYKCLRFGKALSIISERDTTKTCHVCTGSWLPAVYLVYARESICLNT